MEGSDARPSELEPIDMPARPVKVYGIEIEKIADRWLYLKWMLAEVSMFAL